MTAPTAMRPFDTEGKLMRTVQRLIREDPRSLPEIYRDTRVPLSWLNGFVAGAYRNPSVNRLEYLYEQLTGKELPL